MRLPASVQEIADVIGREAALYLVGQLPRQYSGSVGHKSTRVIMYVPKVLKTSDRLVRLIGWHKATALVAAFGGEVMYPANCADVYRAFRDASITRMLADGWKAAELAPLMGCSERHIRNVAREIPPEAKRAACNDNRPTPTAEVA